MRWRWLLGDYADSSFKMTRQQRRDVHMSATQRYVERRALVTVTVVLSVLPAGVVALGFPYLVGRPMLFMAGMLVMLVLFWPLSAWAYSHVWRYVMSAPQTWSGAVARAKSRPRVLGATGLGWRESVVRTRNFLTTLERMPARAMSLATVLRLTRQRRWRSSRVILMAP